MLPSFNKSNIHTPLLSPAICNKETFPQKDRARREIEKKVTISKQVFSTHIEIKAVYIFLPPSSLPALTHIPAFYLHSLLPLPKILSSSISTLFLVWREQNFAVSFPSSSSRQYAKKEFWFGHTYLLLRKYDGSKCGMNDCVRKKAPA